MQEIADLIGIPFKLYGRDKNGLDCYGLVIEMSKRLGHELADLKNIEELSNGNNEKILNDCSKEIIKKCHLEKTKDFLFGNIILFFDNKGRVCHIGVLLNKKDFIHCDINGVHVSNLDYYARKWELYKWQK